VQICAVGEPPARSRSNPQLPPAHAENFVMDVVPITRSSVYEPIDAYPALRGIVSHWRTFRQEALRARGRSGWSFIKDNRVDPDDWSVFPLLPEPEDRPVVPGWETNREGTPETVRILEAEPAIKAYSLSHLRAGGYVRPHEHENPFVTAVVSLQAGPDCYLVVDGERRDFREDEVVIFDYRRLHEARNAGPIDWIALLLLLDPAPRAP
jgi:beta-hydroxylase